MSGGDAVETAARAAYEWVNPYCVEWEQLTEQTRRYWMQRSEAQIQALVDGGHYVPAAEHLAYRESCLRVVAERDAAITRAETAEKLLRQAKHYSPTHYAGKSWEDPKRCKLYMPVDGPRCSCRFTEWQENVHAFLRSPFSHTLARQAVTEEPE